MKGWEQIINMHQFPTSKCSGEVTDYFWDYVNEKWVFIEDNMDMTWAYDRLFGYDAGPGERLRKESETISGKEYKRLSKVTLEGLTIAELIEDAKRKGITVSK